MERYESPIEENPSEPILENEEEGFLLKLGGKHKRMVAVAAVTAATLGAGAVMYNTPEAQLERNQQNEFVMKRRDEERGKLEGGAEILPKSIIDKLHSIDPEINLSNIAVLKEPWKGGAFFHLVSRDGKSISFKLPDGRVVGVSRVRQSVPYDDVDIYNQEGNLIKIEGISSFFHSIPTK